MNLMRFLNRESKAVDFDSQYAATRMVHLVFLGSNLIYVAVGLLAKSFAMEGESGFVDSPNSTYVVLLGVLLAVSVVLGYLVLVVLPRRAAAQDSAAGSGGRSLAEVGQELSQRHFRRVQLSQVIAILGLVLFLHYGSLLPLLLFPGVSLGLLLAIYPRREQWDEARWRAEQEGALKTVE